MTDAWKTADALQAAADDAATIAVKAAYAYADAANSAHRTCQVAGTSNTQDDWDIAANHARMSGVYATAAKVSADAADVAQAEADAAIDAAVEKP